MEKRVGFGTKAGRGDNAPCALVEPAVLFGLTLSGVRGMALVRKRPAAPGNDGWLDQQPRITHIDRTMIRTYFRPHANGRTPLLPEVSSGDRRVAPHLGPRRLPQDLEQKLSLLPAGYQRVIVGNDVVLVELASRVVIDVVREVDDGTLA